MAGVAMIRVYLVINEDSHYDTEVTVFADDIQARIKARLTAIEGARELSDIEERDIEGWLYYATYATEGRVWVVERLINLTQP